MGAPCARGIHCIDGSCNVAGMQGEDFIGEVERQRIRGTSALFRTKRHIGGPELPPAAAGPAKPPDKTPVARPFPHFPLLPLESCLSEAKVRVVYDKHIIRHDSSGPVVCLRPLLCVIRIWFGALVQATSVTLGSCHAVPGFQSFLGLPNAF
jgi:hypothetical protein